MSLRQTTPPQSFNLEALSSIKSSRFFISLYYTRAVGSFFKVGVGGGAGGAEQKLRPPWLADSGKLKKNWVKRPKAVPQKRKFGPNVILCNSFFGNIISGIQLWSARSSGYHQSFFVIPYFVAEVFKASKN